MCSITDCQAKPIAKGLCAKHYMRLKRSGDATKTSKPGPKPLQSRAIMRQTNVSERTLSRYAAALRYLRAAGEDPLPFIKQVSRPSGSMNFSKLEAMAVASYERARPTCDDFEVEGE